MTHGLPEWFDLDGGLAGLQELPIVLQLRSMDFSPGLDQPLLRLRQTARQALEGINCEDGRMLLIERVKVSAVVLAAGFDEHSDDDAKES
jgi:hypothetical protein